MGMKFTGVCSTVFLKKIKMKGPVVNKSKCQHSLNQVDGNTKVYYPLKYSQCVLNIS